MQVYADERTLSYLQELQPTRTVLLLGSYIGYANFGDIVQLKGAIRFHQERTGLEPVLVCALAAVTGPDFTAKIRRLFGVEAVLYISDEHLDASPVALSLLATSREISHLHVYGGGFLNRFWGAMKLRWLEALIRRFSVRAYYLSGQQIDSAFVDELGPHFAQHPPRLAGGRDRESTELLASLGVNAAFSFDDTSEIFAGWVARAPRPTEATKRRLIIHLNTSSYTETPHNALARVLASCYRHFPDAPPLLLQSYNDRRYDVRDTLGTVIQLEDEFPFFSYEVLELGRLALCHDPTDTAVDKALEPLLAGLAVTSSYHTAMFLNMLGVPAYMLSLNDYYRQKSAGLGVEGDLDNFLEDPRLLDFTSMHQERERWLDMLEGAFALPLPEAPLLPESRLTEPDPSPRMFRPKGDGVAAQLEGAVAWQREQTDLWWSKAQEAQAEALEWKGRVEQLELALSELQGRCEAVTTQLNTLWSFKNYLRFRFRKS